MGDSADDTAARIVDKLQQMLRGDRIKVHTDPVELRPPTADWLQGEIAKAIREATPAAEPTGRCAPDCDCTADCERL